MAIRWALCPVELWYPVDDDGNVTTNPIRRPLIAGLIDPSRNKGYQFSAAVGSTECLCFVRASSMQGLDHRDVTNVIEQDYEDADNLLYKTPNQMNWTGGRISRLQNLIVNRGGSTAGLTGDSLFKEWLNRLGNTIAPCNVERLYIAP